jgi:hypothetical protein
MCSNIFLLNRTFSFTSVPYRQHAAALQLLHPFCSRDADYQVPGRKSRRSYRRGYNVMVQHPVALCVLTGMFPCNSADDFPEFRCIIYALFLFYLHKIFLPNIPPSPLQVAGNSAILTAVLFQVLFLPCPVRCSCNINWLYVCYVY